MARKLRVEYPGAIYHIINRGDRREAIFLDDSDRHCFLSTLSEACKKTAWQIHAFCLMGNHFHLVIETPNSNLVAGMKWLLGTYTSRFNRRHKLFGHLFSGRYKALIVDGSGNGYLRTVCDYVHLNPVRANLLTAGQPLSNFAWSSYCYYLLPPSERPPWLRVDRLLGEMGIPADTAAARQQFQIDMEQRRNQASGADCKNLRRGWCLGSEQFRQQLLRQMTARIGPHHYGEQRTETSEHKAERILAEELDRLGWTVDQLHRRPKSDPYKLAIALRLRSETTMSLKWISQRLECGTWMHLTRRLYEARKVSPRPDNNPELRLGI